MTQPELNSIELTILRRLEPRPSWARSLQKVRPCVERLVRLGLAERCAPPTGGARNMVCITEAGLNILDAREVK